MHITFSSALLFDIGQKAVLFHKVVDKESPLLSPVCVDFGMNVALCSVDGMSFSASISALCVFLVQKPNSALFELDTALVKIVVHTLCAPAVVFGDSADRHEVFAI